MENEVVKSPLYSKTLWVNLIMAVSALFIPSVGEWMSANIPMVTMIFTGLNMVLRLVTKDRIGLDA